MLCADLIVLPGTCLPKPTETQAACYRSHLLSRVNLNERTNTKTEQRNADQIKSQVAHNISIKDGSGTVLQRGVSTGSAQYRSPLGSNMQPGTYYLNITTGSKTEVLKFVKE